MTDTIQDEVAIATAMLMGATFDYSPRANDYEVWVARSKGCKTYQSYETCTYHTKGQAARAWLRYSPQLRVKPDGEIFPFPWDKDAPGERLPA